MLRLAMQKSKAHFVLRNFLYKVWQNDGKVYQKNGLIKCLQNCQDFMNDIKDLLERDVYLQNLAKWPI